MFSTDNLPLNVPDRTLALTYDDGPGPRSIAIAEFLSEHGIRATFFVVGKHVREHRDVVSGVKKLGHLIANHTDTHQFLSKLVPEPDKLTLEVMGADREIQEFIGEGPFLLRAPGGEWCAGAAEILNRTEGLRKYYGPFNWDIEFGDYEIGSPRNLKPGNPLYTLEQCQENYLQGIRTRRCGVVLLHDWSADSGDRGAELRRKNRTLELTKWLIPRLSDFRFVALDEISPIRAN
jgi:peptidoglycan/xylan/chitin deacetylase (PgdA/CDA1 family)